MPRQEQRKESLVYTLKDGKAMFAKPFDRGFTIQDVAGNTPMQDRIIAQDKKEDLMRLEQMLENNTQDILRL